MQGKYFILAVLLLSGTLSTTAQRFESINDKFPLSRANCIYQDDYGFMWFGTLDGLVKYDGYSITTYRKIPGDSTSLPGSDVLSVLQISDTSLLVGMRIDGLAIMNRRTGVCKSVQLTTPADILNVNCLANDHNGAVWIGTNIGLYKYSNGVVHSTSHSTQYQGLSNDVVTKLFEDKSGSLWIGTAGGIHRLKPDGNSIESPLLNKGFPANAILDIGEDRLGNLWISVEGGEYRLYTWDDETARFEPDPRFMRDGMFEFTFDDENSLWISSHTEGVYRITEHEETFFSPENYREHGMRALFTWSIEYGKFGNIWLNGDNIYKVAGRNKHVHSIEGDGFKAISVFADEDYIWYCTNEPKRWSRATGETENFLEGIEFTELRDPSRDRRLKRAYHFELWENALVFSTIRNVFVWDRSTDRFTEYPTDMFRAIRDFTIDQDGHAWLTGGDGMPVRMNLKNGAYAPYTALTGIVSSVTVAQCPDDLMWWGDAELGLYSYDVKSKALKHYAPDSDDPQLSISSYSINDILCHSDGTVWVGTKFGLNHIDPIAGFAKQYKFEGRGINPYIASILEGDDGALWLGTQNGIVYYNPVSDSVRQFTTSDGLINTILTPRACFKDPRGCLYFAGDKGIDYFYPHQIGYNLIPPEIYVKSLHIGNRTVDEPVAGECIRDLALRYNENSVEIELIGLHLVSPEANVCAYRLPHQSPEWHNMGKNRTITLVNLSPGEYLLEGKSANADGIWSTPKVLLKINVHPPFWLTSWFMVLAGLCIAVLLYAVYRLRIQQIQKAEQVKTAFNKRLAEIEMKALRAQMNPHFLFNSLNSVRLLIDKGNNEQAKQYLTKYAQLIRLILSNSRKKFIRLDEELETLRIYLDLEQMRFKNFNYEIIVDPFVETDFLEVPPLLLQPYVENALWHGLMNKQDGDRNLRISVKRKEDLVSVVIEDNGIGRKQAEALKTGNTSKKESLGLKISEERLVYLRDLYGSEVQVNITDLENETGTRVTITLPVPE